MPCFCYINFINLLTNVNGSIVTDYACTANDWSIIANIRNEVSVKRNLVCIEDAFLKKPELLLLLTPGEFVGDEVSIYI